jgi:hypothetical protein
MFSTEDQSFSFILKVFIKAQDMYLYIVILLTKLYPHTLSSFLIFWPFETLVLDWSSTNLEVQYCNEVSYLIIYKLKFATQIQTYRTDLSSPQLARTFPKKFHIP